MRKILPLLLLLLCLPVLALADAKMDITPYEYGFSYDITAKEDWIVLIWKNSAENGRQTLYSPGGHFTGEVDLVYSGAGGKTTVTVQNLKQHTQAKQQVTLPKAADYVAPSGKTAATIKELNLTETTTGFKYSFSAPNTDYMLLYFRSKCQEAVFPVYPVNAEGLYEGEIFSPLTYARTLYTVQVRNAKGQSKIENTVRMGYEAPPAPEGKPGRLSGVVVCIDPGHQENGEYVREPIGPGLEGTTVGKGGMAQGKVTLRKESIVVMETSIILRDLLLAEGATVVLTRDRQDIFHTNIERCEIAEQAGAHIMLRLHCNNSSKTSKSGIQIYCPLNSDYARAVAAPEEYRALAQAFLDEMKTAVGYDLKDATGTVRLNDSYVGNNWAKMPCFLVEMGYMSNAGEDELMATASYQAKLVKGMADGIDAYFGR